MKLKTQTLNGVKCEIDVDTDGEFRCRVAGEWLKDATLTGLVTQLRRVTKRTKVTVAVPLSVLGQEWHERPYQRGSWGSGHGVRHVLAVSLGIDGDPKYRDEKTGEMVTGERFSRFGDVVRRLTPDEVAKYMQLAKAKAAADAALSAFERSVRLKDSPEELVRAAIAEKIDTPKEDRELEEG